MADLFADLRALLAASAALPEYRADAEAYAMHRASDRVTVVGFAPRVKVARVLVQLASAAPGLRVARVTIEGASGCGDFRGTLSAEDADGRAHRFAFHWDCRWRAEVAGWVSPSGAPDQRRAAAVFGWRCFAEWRSLEAADAEGPDADAPNAACDVPPSRANG
jgi:hypothetical protein